MKKIVSLLLLALCTLVSCVQQNKSEVDEESDTTGVKTEYYYEDKDKVEYPIYLTETGRAYIIKENNGKVHKMYLPE